MWLESLINTETMQVLNGSYFVFYLFIYLLGERWIDIWIITDLSYLIVLNISVNVWYPINHRMTASLDVIRF